MRASSEFDRGYGVTAARVAWDAGGQQELLARADELLQRPGRSILGIIGPPGAGKSTIADWLLGHLLVDYPRQVAIVPMDGFHLAQSILEQRGLEHRKGAPDTFDSEGFVAMLRRLRVDTTHELFAPAYRRDVGDAIAGAISVLPETRLVIAEGNYLLLEKAPWTEVPGLLDDTWFVELEESERQRRLAARHLRYDGDLAVAQWRARGNDQENAGLVASGIDRSRIVIEY